MKRQAFLLILLLQQSNYANTPDNELTQAERDAGWKLLFDGKTLTGWMTSGSKPSKRPVEPDGINPHLSGDYMMVREEEWADFVLSLDFKITKGCNSGIFVRTSPLTKSPGKDVGYNGMEIAIDDTAPGADFHDTGAIYDLVKPRVNAMKTILQWNHIDVTCDGPIIRVVLNGEAVTEMDLDQWTEKGKRPDGSPHKFDTAYKEHPRKGYFGLQDHGSDCWFKNIKILPLAPWKKDPADQSLAWAREMFALEPSLLPTGWRSTLRVESLYDREVRVLTFSEPGAALEAIFRGTIKREAPGLEWTVEFTNHGKQDVRVRESMKGLKLFISRQLESEGTQTQIGPLGGRPSDSKDWDAGFMRESDLNEDVPGSEGKSGPQSLANRILHPGESLRLPRTLGIIWWGKDPGVGYPLLQQLTELLRKSSSKTGK